MKCKYIQDHCRLCDEVEENQVFTFHTNSNCADTTLYTRIKNDIYSSHIIMGKEIWNRIVESYWNNGVYSPRSAKVIIKGYR